MESNVNFQMMMWNLVDGKLLRTITDAHPPGSAILSVKVTTVTSSEITQRLGLALESASLLCNLLLCH